MELIVVVILFLFMLLVFSEFHKTGSLSILTPFRSQRQDIACHNKVVLKERISLVLNNIRPLYPNEKRVCVYWNTIDGVPF